MLTKSDWQYLGGLVDGEGWIGVSIRKASRYSNGFKLSPVFQISLCAPDSDSLTYWKENLGGSLTANPKSGYAWRVESKGQVMKILSNLQNVVHLPSTKRKIEIVKEILRLNPLGTATEPKKLRPLVRELRQMSKRKRNGVIRHWV